MAEFAYTSDDLSSILLIPAYRPGPELPQLVAALESGVFREVVVVDDGSGPEFASIFASCTATVLRHEANRGKGAALKTGIAHILKSRPEVGIVTADADGQHAPEDIARVVRRLEREPGALVLGSRSLDASAPARSVAGNRLASVLVHALIGQRLRDTQTGLRGIPIKLAEHLQGIASNGYEFELAMLTAAKHLSVPVVEEPIRTIYQEGNPTSHFQPFRDSMRIGFVLLRFSSLSIATALLDNAVFLGGIGLGWSVAIAQVCARVASVVFNYPLARRAVFLSQQPHRRTLTRYLALVALNGVASYQLMGLLSRHLGLSVPWAKIAAESGLFLVNFIVQRDVVFVRKRA